MKKLLLTFNLLIGCVTFYAQGYDDDTHYNFTRTELIDNPSIQPPDVTAFQKVHFIPVSNYTGRADISIPIYTIKSGGISVPISLSYNSSGVKIDDIPSSVGSNWSLNAGGAISKIVRGIEDVGYNVWHTTESDYMQIDFTVTGWLFNNFYHKSEFLSGMLGSGGAVTKIHNIHSDSQPDLFLISAPGLNTKYTHDVDGNIIEISGDKNKIIENFVDINAPSYGRIVPRTGPNGIGHSYEHIDENTYYSNDKLFCINKIETTSISGIHYTFQDLDISQNIQTVYDEALHRNVKTSDRKVESYKLSKIKDIKSNKEVTFEYEKYKIKNYNTIDGKRFTIGNWQEQNTQPDYPMSVKYPQINRLKKINYDNGSIEFIYGITRQDLTEDKALTEIIIKDKKGKIIKKINLEYGYMQNSSYVSNTYNKRLRLDKVYTINSQGNKLPGYELTYNSTALPPRNKVGQDFLGYSNGAHTSTNSGSKPKLYFYPEQGIHSFLPVYKGSGYYLLSGDFSLSSNINYAKAGILEKIQYPTGGFSEFEYELNQFKIGSSTISGGGLRIKSQKIKEGNGFEQILDYEYKKTDGTSSGSMVSFPVYNETQLKQNYSGNLSTSSTLNYYAFKIYRVSRAQAELTHNSFVGYSRVLVKDRVSNGYTEYKYSSPTTIFNELPTIITQQTYGSLSSEDLQKINRLKNNGVLPTFKINRDLLRGNLLETNIFNNNNQLKKKTQNFYTHKVLTDNTAESTLQIKSLLGITSNYYRKTIKQNFHLYSERNLLTKSITTDYLDGGSTSITKEIVYDANYPLVKQNKILDNTKVLLNKYYYPHNSEVSNGSYMSNLRSQNRFSEMVKQEAFQDGQKVHTELIKYSDFGGLYLPKEIYTAKGSNGLEAGALITKRTNDGKILEFKNQDNVYTTFIYGYNNNSLIAKIENARYSEVDSWLNSVESKNISYILGLSNNETTDSSENTLIIWLNKLRNAVYSRKPNTKVSTYTYNPLVGVTSITDNRGKSMRYVYDEFNRLSLIKDTNNKVLKRYEYNYKNQQ